MDKMLDKLQKLKYVADIPVYLLDRLQSDYSYKSTVIEMLPRIIETFHDPYICIPLILEFLLDHDRKNLYNYLLKEKLIRDILYEELISSSFYQHRLALCEILKQEGVLDKDIEHVKELIYDNIEIVRKSAILLVDERFGQQYIFDLIKEFFDESYFLQGASPLLLKCLKNSKETMELIKKFLDCETWLVRYNLCNVIDTLDIDEDLRNVCCEKLAIDSVEEVRILFAKIVCIIRNKKIQLYYIKKLSYDTSSLVRLKLASEINNMMRINNDPLIHKFLINTLKNMLRNNENDLKLLSCEIICRYMRKIFLENTTTETIKIINEIEPELELSASYNTIEDFLFLFDHFKVFSENNKWRSRIRLLNMIIDIGSDNMEFFNTNLKVFFFLLLKDRVEIIRHNTGNAFVGLVNKFGSSFFILNYNEVLNLVTSDKYMIRIISLEILSKISLLENIEKEIYHEYVYPLLDMLKNDSVECLRVYYNEIIESKNIIYNMN